MPSRKNWSNSSGAVKTAAPQDCDEQEAKERPSAIDRGLARSGPSNEPTCPFATFAEWASDVDEAVYTDL